MCEPSATRLVAQNTEAPLTCKSAHWTKAPKLLGRLTGAGVHLWCSQCRAEHLIPWAEMDRLRGGLCASK